MSTIIATLMAAQLTSFSAEPATTCAAPEQGLAGVVTEVSNLSSGRDFDRRIALESLGDDSCGYQPSLRTAGTDSRELLDTPVRFSAYSRVHRADDGLSRGGSLGLTIELDAETVDFPSMAIVAGVDRRTVFLAPGTDGFQRPVVNMSDSLDVADGYGGIAWRLNPDRFVSVSYVRQERSFNSGMTEWREEDHFVGFVFNQRW